MSTSTVLFPRELLRRGLCSARARRGRGPDRLHQGLVTGFPKGHTRQVTMAWEQFGRSFRTHRDSARGCINVILTYKNCYIRSSRLFLPAPHFLTSKTKTLIWFISTKKQNVVIMINPSCETGDKHIQLYPYLVDVYLVFIHLRWDTDSGWTG